MDRVEDLEELRAMAPPPLERRLSPRRQAELREVLVREIAGSLPSDRPEPTLAAPGSRPRRRLRRVLVAALLPAALVGGAVAYSMTANRTASQLGDLVTCFQAPRLDAPSAGSSFTGQTLASFCQAQWNSGSLTAPPPGPAPSRWVACEGDGRSGGVDVFPGSDQDLCGHLGLQPVPPGYYEAVKRYAAMESDLWSRFPESSCANAADAIAVTRRVLDSHGYTTWEVRSSGFDGLTPCALAPDLDPVNGLAVVRGGVRPELRAAVQGGLDRANACGPENVLLEDVQQALRDAGFGDWTARIDHALTAQWPCVAGFNEEPATKTIVLTGYASG